LDRKTIKKADSLFSKVSFHARLDAV
jgi:hypothetical protein